MNPARILTVCMTAMLVAGSAALAADPAPDPRTTVLPVYTLPAGAAADGKLAEWGGIPPVPAERFNIGPFNSNPDPAKRPAPDNFAPTLRCGMKPGSPDLYFLIVVRDSQRYTEPKAAWIEGDRVELFLDFGRQARDEQQPDWRKLQWKDRDRFHRPPGFGQFGLGPQTLAFAAQARTSGDTAENWKYDYACVPVEGGTAYELRLDGQSVIDSLGAKVLPERVGFELILDDQDNPLVLRTEGWSNGGHQGGDSAWLFIRERMAHAFTDQYGILSLRPQPTDAGAAAAAPPPKTLAELFGIDPTAAQVEQSIATLPAERLADLVYWAGLSNVQFTPALVKALMQVRSPLVRENCLAMLNYTAQPKEAAQAACESAYAATDAALQSPNVLVLANLVNEKYALGFGPEVTKLAAHPDLTVAISATRALAKVGAAADIAPLEQAIAARIADLKGSATIPEMQRVGLVRAVEVFMQPSLEALKLRVEPIVIPTATPVVTVKAENTDLPRLMPLDNNNVYNAKALLRAWPKDGPKELWRMDVGEGKSAVTEVGGRAFTAAQFDGKQWALCLNPATGATIWKHEIYPKAASDVVKGPIVTPLVDGNRVYFIATANASPYDPISPVYCLNAEDGAEIWRSDDNEYASQGSATPLIVDDTLYIPAGKSGKGKILVAVDKLTGKPRWSVADPQKRPDTYGSSASPAYQIIDGIPQIICGVYGGTREAWAVSAKTGELYWSHPTPMHHSLISSPVATGSRVVLCGGQGSAAFSACLQMYVRDGKVRARQLYRSEKNQVNMYHTVAVLSGAVYGFGSKSLQCTSLEDGRLLWEQAGNDWGMDQPLIVADGLIFALGKRGDLVLIEANQTGYKELGRVATRIKLGIPQQPTIANGRLYVRGDTTVVCYDLLKDGERADAGSERPGVKGGGNPPQRNAGSATGLMPDGAAKNWPGFRGPGGLATVGDGKAPTTAADIGRVRWKVDLSHSGRSSPVVWGDHVFLTGADKTQGVVYCFETGTGKPLWRRECLLTGPASSSKETGYAAPTPATDGNRVYATFASGDVVAFDMNGTPAWQVKLGEHKSAYGYASSLVLYQNLLLVQYDQQKDGADGGSALLALDARTGKTAWRIKRNMGPSWSTPLVIGTRRGPQVIVCANNGITAYAPEDGREIWTVHGETQELVPTPTIAGGLIIATMTGSGTMAISPDGQGDVTKTHVAWSDEDAVTDVPSPVGCGDLFFRLFAGKLICHQAADGKEVGSLELEGEFYASPIVCDGALLLLDRDGAMTAVRAGPALEKIGTRAVGKSANASPAMADGRLFVRTDKALVCIDTRTPPEERAAIPTAGLTITKALAGKVDVTKVLAAKVKDNRLVIVATSAFLGVDAGNDKIVVDYVLDGKKQTLELSAIAGDELGVATPGADWVKGVAVLGASKPLPAKGLGIKFAIYGKREGWVDVSEPCNAAIANNKLTIVASDQLAGDPSSGAGKIMLVSYVLDGKEGTKSCEQGQELAISTDTLTAQQEWDALPPLKATFSRKIERRNTDLNRFIPDDGNTVFNAAGLLRTWPKDGPRELWRLKTGPSIGATVESGGRAFATGQLDGKQWAYCLEAKTGKIIWKTELAPEYMLPAHWWGTVASPLVDEDRVYYIPYQQVNREEGKPDQKGPNEICPLVCLRVSDGKELWRSGGDIPLVNGFSTPLVVGGTLFVLPQRAKDVLVALDKFSGKVLWTGKERQPKHAGAPYAGASPTYLELDGQGQLIYGLGNDEIIGVSVKDGSILWTIPRVMGHGLMASAVAVSNRVFLCSGENRFSMCIELKKREGQYVAEIVYQSSKNQLNWFNTPAIHDGAVYGFGSFRLQCSDLANGELIWEQFERRDWDTKQQLIIADGLIFGLTKAGELVMAEANKAGYKELGRVRHGLEIHHTQQPTLANGRLYIRGLDTVVCYQLTEALLESTPDWGSSVKPQ